MRSRRGHSARGGAFAVAAMCTLTACVTERTPTDPVRDTYAAAPTREERRAAIAERPLGDLRAAGTTHSARVVAEVQPRGTIPFDRMSLPLVSADGGSIATQVGVAPSWDALLARPGAAFSGATRVDIYHLEAGTNAPPRLHVGVNESVLLGRSSDAQGFLVEAPMDDGSRRIGFASWATGEVGWIVADDRVNAFATLGPRGELAWSRRTRTGHRWELVVRADGREWSLPAQEGDWLYPTWSGHDRGLFVGYLREGELELMYMDARDEDTALRSVDSVALAVGCDDLVAHQALAGTVTLGDMPNADIDRIAFHHPSRIGAAFWAPGTEPVVFPHDTFQAVVDPEAPAYALVTAERNLQWRRMDGSQGAYSNLIAGMHIARRTTNPARPWILLRPQNSRIGLTVMRLLPVDTEIR